MGRILLVEDDKVTAMLLARSITKSGHEVEIAPNGLAAVEMLEDGPWALLITDMMMPRMGGAELHEFVRADERFVDLPILVTTGVVDAQKLAWANDAPGVEVVPKPVSLSALVEKIGQLLDPHL